MPTQYALEARPNGMRTNTGGSGPKVELTPGVEERRTANTREFERLRAWSDALRLRKRDLLHSDTEGNRAYELELAQYNAALEKANTERSALWPAAKK
jgi:hypothetical protein